MPIDIRKYINIGGSSSNFNTTGYAVLQGDNFYSGQNVFVNPIQVQDAVGINDAVNLGQLDTAINLATQTFVTVSQLNAGLATKLNLSGGQMSGELLLSRDPVDAMEAATKEYVDNSRGGDVYTNRSNTFLTGFTNTFQGSVIVGNATASGNPVPLGQMSSTLTNFALLNSPVFSGTPTVPTAPTNSNDLTAANTAWVRAFAAPVSASFSTSANYTITGTWAFSNELTVATAVAGTSAVNLSQMQTYVTGQGYVTASSTVTWTNPQTYSSLSTFNSGLVINANALVESTKALVFGSGGRILSSDTQGPILKEDLTGSSSRWQVEDSSSGLHLLMDARGGTFTGNINGPDAVGNTDYTTLQQLNSNVTAALASYAPIASPTFTGIPKTPTPGSTPDPNQVTNVQWVQSQLGGQFNPASSYTITGNWTFNNPVVVPAATADNQAVNRGEMNTAISGFATTAQLSSYALLTGAAFTGTVSNTGSFTSSAAIGFQGSYVVTNGSAISFYGNGGATGAALLKMQSGVLSLTMPSGNNNLAVYNNSGTSLGNVLVNPMTGVGDTIIGGAGGAPTRVAAGTNGQVWTMVGGSPAWSTAISGNPYFVAASTSTTYPVTSGTTSIGIGPNATAAANYSMAVSFDAANAVNIQSAATQTIAIGRNITVDQSSSIVLGSGLTTMGTNSYNISIGFNNNIGNSSTGGVVIVGHNSKAISQGTAIGGSSTANAQGAVAIGNASVASNTQNIAIGYNANNSGSGSIVIGPSLTVAVNNAVVIGANTAASNGGATVVGTGSSSASGSVAIGNVAVSSGLADVSIGNATTASGQSAIALGSGAVASAATSMAIGVNTIANSSNNVAFGYGASAYTGGNNVVVGALATSSGGFSVTMGTGASNVGANNVVIGNAATGSASNVTAIGSGAIGATGGGTALGYNANATGSNSIALGYQAHTVTDSSVSVGAFATSSVANVVAVGYNAQAATAQSMAIGYGSNAANGTAIGFSSISNAANATAIGASTSAQGASSIALGQGSTTTSAQTNCVSLGTSVATRSIINMTNGANLTDGATVQNVGMFRSVNQQTANYTLALADINGVVVNGAAVTTTIPPNSSVAIPIGAYIWVVAKTGTTTIAAGSGVTLTGTTSVAAGAKVMLIQIAANTWISA